MQVADAHFDHGGAAPAISEKIRLATQGVEERLQTFTEVALRQRGKGSWHSYAHAGLLCMAVLSALFLLSQNYYQSQDAKQVLQQHYKALARNFTQATENLANRYHDLHCS